MTKSIFLGSVILTLMIIGPIIVNAQPGTKFYWLGIDWKADNLDNTLFWLGIVFVVLGSIGASYDQREKNKRFEKKIASGF